ncbi:16S rRNA (cytosine(967)-C(5))-methyltransferase RsmB [Tahibacter amnicola]|uniref:16S rRNA (cytosine(967)-C(5))-methyltransferase n=1 Tax=Tahibacter amnicola TaxID=2976241 RepID=A0ABY6BDA6_9GAMM|nr:16S rRNA (cytosine(967)-C(5))-methyltransferase RsmB [Tahibacter amnicola]UXI67815.1 16S rRNA (cytosine(967)-C(5))-methyltransferase RsmB [Tahibacter amnicola]
MNDARALAAQGLDRIVRGGVSLRAAFAELSPRIKEPRDRALLSALLHDGARWWPRYDAVLDRLVQKPLRTREPLVHALMVLGLVQVAAMGMAEYAAVAATVEAARRLNRPHFAGLINAVLRRFLRDRDDIEAMIQADPVAASAHPRWLMERLQSDWPGQWPAIIAAGNAAAPLVLRVNRRRATVDALLARLLAAGIEAQKHAHLADAVVLAESTDVTQLPGFAEGLFSVQDGAAQLTAPLLALAAGQRVLDACAAPGGKAAQCLEQADVKLLALDRDARRLESVTDTLQRLGLSGRCVAADAATPDTWWDGQPFHRILLDAPCSATGVIRRQPDIRLHRRAADIAPLVAEQARLLEALWPLLAPDGRLVYATCSILRAENADQVDTFLARHPDAVAETVIPEWFGRASGAGRQNLPGENGMDGFFYAVLRKAG